MGKRTRRAGLLACLVSVLVVGALPPSVGAEPTELFLSEYIEGSSNNKALEVFNGTGAAVDLAAGGYSVQMFFNGNPVAGLTINLVGTVADGDVFVLAHSSAHADILAQADQTNGAGWFNGDDAVVLRKGTAFVDVIGQVGFDPGSEWGSGLTSTADNTLRRKGTIEAGDPNGSDAFDPAMEWDGFATDTFGGLGAHVLAGGNQPVVATCGGPLVTDEGTAATRQVSASDADGTVIDIQVTSVTPDPSHGSITLGNLIPASGDGGTATGDVTVDANTPAGTYSVLITATNDDETPQTGTCTLTVQVLPPPRPIYEIQGSGATSPFAGTQQRTSGLVTVVTGNGIFVQDPAGDGDPATSDGIFVFLGSSATAFSPGDEVSVNGTVVEFRPSSRPRDLTVTEFSPATVTETGTGAALPAAVAITDRPDEVISPDGIDAFERLEGMLVSIDDPLVVGPTNFFGEIVVVASGDAGNATPNGNIVLRPLAGDAVDYNPERVLVDDEARVGGGSSTRINNPMVSVRIGDQATGDVVGAMDYQFSNYRVQAGHPVSDVLTGTVPDSPISDLRDPAPYEGRVATFNVENLFDCVDAPGKDDTHPTCDGDDLADLETQLAKLAKALQEELETPELLVIEEVENAEVLTGDGDGFVPGTSIPALLPRIPGTPYDAVSFDSSDPRGIEVAFVFDTSRVTLGDAYLSTDVLPDAEGLFDGSGIYGAAREPLVGEFTLDDIDLALIGVHLKSKGGPQLGVDPTDHPPGDDPLYGAFQPPTRWTEELRHKQADYLRDLVDLLISQGAGDLMVAGDFNDFEFGEPGEGEHTLARITDSSTDPLANLMFDLDPAQRYTFVFEGNSQALDHMLANASLEARHTEQAAAHFNAGFPASLSGDPTVTFRSSDHDPLVAYFCTDATAPSLSVSASPSVLFPPNHKYRRVTTTVTASDDRDEDVAVTLLSVTSNEPDDAPGGGDGNTVNDIVIVNDTTFLLRAERDENGTGRVYTIEYEATDACGNTTVATAQVLVPVELG